MYSFGNSSFDASERMRYSLEEGTIKMDVLGIFCQRRSKSYSLDRNIFGSAFHLRGSLSISIFRSDSAKEIRS